MTARRLLVVTVLGLTAGCGGPATPQPRSSPKRAEPVAQVMARYEVVAQPYPVGKVIPASFSVTNAGLVLVPTGGGVYLAGWSGWLVEPRTPPVIASAPLGDGLVVASATDSGVVLERWQNGAVAGRVGQLPLGMYQLATAPNGAIWASGREASGSWVIYHAESGGLPARVTELRAPILSLGVANDSAAVVAVANEALLVRRGLPPVVIARAHDPIEGVAVEPGGTVLFTTRRGLWRLDGVGHATQLASGLHGPLAARGKRIYVMRQDKNDVVTLTDPLARTP